ncbi:hypothetical protein [Eudoraea adriatica]|uniref:hypothetical protein n=1 Tax=Eudoraea adriatica TaxID=446681 RepID=UPI00037B5485|nr:hypothetical protein [Eudoraea adriatica]
MAIINQFVLYSYNGKHISDICLNKFDGDTHNHCAHFVSHVLQIGHGKTCHRMVHKSHQVMAGGSILVSDLFDITPNIRELISSQKIGQGLIYVSAPGSFSQIGSNSYRIKTVRKRHVGIFLNGKVWHYKNSKNKVISEPIFEFIRHYKKQVNALWIGDLPIQSQPVQFGMCNK